MKIRERFLQWHILALIFSISVQYSVSAPLSSGVDPCKSNDQGFTSSQKLIWKNDFGTFKSEREYYVWDYTDISEPKKVHHTATKDFRYCLSDVGISAPQGASSCGHSGAVASGGHEVAAYISWNYGAKLQWAAMCGNGTRYGYNSANHYFPDHTNQFDGTERYGACLFVNAKGGDYTNDPLLVYKQEIKNLCVQTNLTVKCYVNTFSDSKNPIRIKIIVYDSEHPTQYRAESELIEKKSVGSSPQWIEVAVTLDQIISSNLTFEIHDYAQNVGDNGDDLLLDDIQVYACSTPSIDLFFDNSFSTQKTASCNGKNITLHAQENELLKSFYLVDLGYLFQYNTANPDDPDFKRKWENLTPKSIAESSYEQPITTIVKEIKEATQGRNYPNLYFRVVAGNSDIINNTIASSNYFNPDDPCSDFSISKPILLDIECPTCTEPADFSLAAKGGRYEKAENTVYLCEGESTTLQTEGPKYGSPKPVSALGFSTQDKNGNWYTNYTVSWLQEGEVIHSESPTAIAPPLTVKYSDVTEDGIEYKVLVHDNIENEEGTKDCDKSASIIVKRSPKPQVPELKIPVFCEGEASLSDNVKNTLNHVSASLLGHSFTFIKEDETFSTMDELLKSMDQLKYNGSDHPYSFVITNEYTGCSSDTSSFSVSLHSKPEIIAADSIDVHTREIITDDTKGTPPFSYWIVNQSDTSSSPIFYDLSFSPHTAYVKDDNGCKNHFIFYNNAPQLSIPEFFTPNGDGVNDTWVIGNLSEYFPNARIQIYDRYGKMISEISGEENSWKGEYNGNLLPSTDYWYVINIGEIDRQFTGHFLLIRE